MPAKTNDFDLNDYEVIDPVINAASIIVSDMWVKLGKPQDPFSASGAKLVDVMIAVWMDLCPEESKAWLAARVEYKDTEMSTSEQVRKHTGRSLASYPYVIYGLMRACFRGFSPTERKNCLKMVSKWPLFQMANKA